MSIFQNVYAKRLKKFTFKNFYAIKSPLFRISLRMKIHLLGSLYEESTPPPPYRNNRYIIIKKIPQNQGGFNPH